MLKELKMEKQLHSECSVVEVHIVREGSCRPSRMLRLQVLSFGRKKTVQRTEQLLTRVLFDRRSL